MKKLTSLIVIFFVFLPKVFSQDTIKLTTGEKIIVNIVESSEKYVRYKKIDKPNGRIYKEKKSMIFVILYENSTIDSVFQRFNPTYIEPKPVVYNYTNSTQIITQKIETRQENAEMSKTESDIYFKKNAVYQNNNKLNKEKIEQFLSSNSEALKMYRNGMSNKVSGYIFGGVSGFLIGYGIGNMIGFWAFDNQVNWTTVGVCEGIGCFLLFPAILFEAAGNKKIKKSINIYNKKYSYNPTLNFGLTSNGVEFNINF